jgi:hypothetical protein
MMLTSTRWVKREARPISLSQMMFYERQLTKERLLRAGNYVREELPTRYVLCDNSSLLTM